MPLGTCVECGQTDILGAGLVEGEPFFCCDCDVELQSYTTDERRSPASAWISRGQRATASGDALAPELSKVIFDPAAGNCPVEIAIDPDRALFAGTGSEVWSTAVPLAHHLHAILAQELPRQVPERPFYVVELGAGPGAVGIWLWRCYYPRLQVCISDLPRLCPLLQLNAHAALKSVQRRSDSDVPGAPETGDAEQDHVPSLIVRPVRWGVSKDLASFAGEAVDLVIGSDICYNPGKVEPLMNTIRALKPRLGALLCLGLCAIRASGAWALQERCEELSWTWEEVETLQGTDGKEALLAKIIPSKSVPFNKERELRRLHKTCRRIRTTLASVSVCDEHDLQRIRKQCERLHRCLSSLSEAGVDVDGLMHGVDLSLLADWGLARKSDTSR